MIRNAQAFLIIIFVSACSLWINHTPAKAGGGGRTHAIGDGIGYRSNLIDPLNPYAVPGELILGELLRRYGFLSESLDLGKMPATEIEKHATGADQTINRDRYLEKLLSFIPNPELQAEITATTPQYDYGYGKDKGIVPRSCEEIFERISRNTDENLEYDVVVSMLEIYNEKVQDLLISDIYSR